MDGHQEMVALSSNGVAHTINYKFESLSLNPDSTPIFLSYYKNQMIQEVIEKINQTREYLKDCTCEKVVVYTTFEKDGPAMRIDLAPNATIDLLYKRTGDKLIHHFTRPEDKHKLKNFDLQFLNMSASHSNCILFKVFFYYRVMLN